MSKELSMMVKSIMTREMKEMGQHLVKTQCAKLDLDPDDLEPGDIPALANALSQVMTDFTSREKAKVLNREILKLGDIKGMLETDVDPLRKLEVLMDLAEASMNIGEWEKTQEHIDRAKEVVDSSKGLDHAIPEITAKRGLLLKEQGNMEEAQVYLVKALKQAMVLNDPIQQARCQYYLGDTQWRLGKLEEAQRSLERALKLGSSDMILEAHIQVSKASVETSLKNPEEAERLYSLAIESLSETDQSRQLGRAYNNLGDMLLGQERLAEARIAFEKAASVFKVSGFIIGEALADANLGEIHIKTGNLDAAGYMLSKSQSILEGTNAIMKLAGVYRNWGLLHTARKDKEKAEEFFGKAREKCVEAGIRFLEGIVVMDWGTAQKELGDDGWRATLEESVKIFEEAGSEGMARAARGLLEEQD